MVDINEMVKETIKKRNEVKDHFIAQYLAETGASITDTVLCEYNDIKTGIIRYWCEPKSENDKRPMAPRIDDNE